MKIAALADLHLGYSQFPAIRNGRNAREFDIYATWHRVVNSICEHSPDLVTIAGDVFHRSRVSNHAIRAYLLGLNTILRRTYAEIHIVQGNHEASRSAAVMCPNEIAHTLDSAGRIFTYATAETHFDAEERYILTALPFETVARPNFIFPVTDPGKPSVLVIHGAIQAPGISKFYAGDNCPHIDDLAKHFDVICAGDYHDMTMLENDHCPAFYSGSIDFTSTNFWPERSDKGWMLVELDSGKAPALLPMNMEPPRPVIDLTATGCTDAERLNRYLDELYDHRAVEGADDEPIMRVVVPGFDRSDRPNIDQTLVKRLKAQCLHFQLDLRTVSAADDNGDAQTFQTRSLRDMFDEFFAGDPKPVRERAATLIDERWRDLTAPGELDARAT
ncbi:MAG: metallophosphoesterase [Gemmatimonadota bacterium]|nr:metallophosphoesterase [Gemmatimonadota bacterium]